MTKPRDFLAKFEQHMEWSQQAYVLALKAQALYNDGKIRQADAMLKRAEALRDKIKKLEAQ